MNFAECEKRILSQFHRRPTKRNCLFYGGVTQLHPFLRWLRWPIAALVESSFPFQDGSNRRKKPELQHYKPGAFNSTRRSDYNDGNNGRSELDNRKMSDSDRSGSRGGGGGSRSNSGRGKNQVLASASVSRMAPRQT